MRKVQRAKEGGVRALQRPLLSKKRNSRAHMKKKKHLLSPEHQRTTKANDPTQQGSLLLYNSNSSGQVRRWLSTENESRQPHHVCLWTLPSAFHQTWPWTVWPLPALYVTISLLHFIFFFLFQVITDALMVIFVSYGLGLWKGYSVSKKDDRDGKNSQEIVWGKF